MLSLLKRLNPESLFSWILCAILMFFIFVSVSQARVFIVVPFCFYIFQFHKKKGKMLDLTTITNMIYFWIFMHFQLFFGLDLFRNMEEISFILLAVVILHAFSAIDWNKLLWRRWLKHALCVPSFSSHWYQWKCLPLGLSRLLTNEF